MSRAFIREDDQVQAEAPPELKVSNLPNWVTPQGLRMIDAKLEALGAALAEGPAEADVAWIRRVIPDEQDTNQSRWPTDPVWRVVQSAMFHEAPAEARRLIRRRQRGAEVTKLDDVQFGCMISRTAKPHPEGGQWTLSRAMGEVSGSLEAIEAKKTLAGKDFGELVR